jgi:hypothetical protein
MAKPRKPLSLLRATGTFAKNPGRYSGRNEPLVTDPIGGPPDWLPDGAKVAWRELTPTWPWLNRSHRGITEIACILAAKLADGTLGVPGMQLLRVTLGQLGATPADFAKVNWMPPAGDDEDAGSEYFR